MPRKSRKIPRISVQSRPGLPRATIKKIAAKKPMTKVSVKVSPSTDRSVDKISFNTVNRVKVKIQTDLKKSNASVMLKNPVFGISPGQAAVFYDLVDENRVLGGGWIKSTKNYLDD